MKIRTSKKGKIFTSPTTDIKYRVFRWKEFPDGKIEAMKKERIKN